MDKKTGIKCKLCKSKTRVYYTIPKMGFIVRGRQCIKCGSIRHTAER